MAARKKRRQRQQESQQSQFSPPSLAKKDSQTACKKSIFYILIITHFIIVNNIFSYFFVVSCPSFQRKSKEDIIKEHLKRKSITHIDVVDALPPVVSSQVVINTPFFDTSSALKYTKRHECTWKRFISIDWLSDWLNLWCKSVFKDDDIASKSILS